MMDDLDDLNDQAGKTYIAYARCAAADGAALQLDAQIRLIRQFADHQGMRCVDEVRLAGVGGWFPALRPDLLALLDRRQRRRDFEVLVVTDPARLTRAGVAAAAEIQTAFANQGVRIVDLNEVALVAQLGHQIGRLDARAEEGSDGGRPCGPPLSE